MSRLLDEQSSSSSSGDADQENEAHPLDAVVANITTASASPSTEDRPVSADAAIKTKRKKKKKKHKASKTPTPDADRPSSGELPGPAIQRSSHSPDNEPQAAAAAAGVPALAADRQATPPLGSKKRKRKAAAAQTAPSASPPGDEAPRAQAAEQGDELYSLLYKDEGANRFSKLADTTDGARGGSASDDFERELSRELRDGGPDDGSDGEAEAAPAGRSKKKRRAEAAAEAPRSAPLLGVTIVDDEEEQPNGQVQKLLRVPRYFDPDYEEAGVRCFNCGGRGHMSRDCPNDAKARPCFLCAQFGHARGACPNMICFRCMRPGHMARECPQSGRLSSWQEQAVCLRCGSGTCPCAGQGDYVRAEGGCETAYDSEDLCYVLCYVCGKRGHACCAASPQQPTKPSCYNCGEGGHTAESCWRDKPAPVRLERRDSSRGRLESWSYEESARYSVRSPPAQTGYYAQASTATYKAGNYGSTYSDAGESAGGRSYGSNGYGTGQGGNYASRVARMYGASGGDRQGSLGGGKGGGGRGWGQTSYGAGKKGDKKPYGYGAGKRY